jgi:hypothetical protein
MEDWPVGPEGKKIIAVAPHHGLGNRRLRSHRVDGDREWREVPARQWT